MHMPAGWILKHQRTKGCDRNTQIWWQRKDISIAIRCEGATFILIGEDDADCIEGVETFYYLRRILDRSDDD